MHSGFLSTHADRQGVDMSFTVCVFFVCLLVCTVTDFSAEDEASGFKFCRASLAGNLTFLGTLLPQKSRIGRIGQRVKDDECSGWWLHDVPIKFARRVYIGSACVDIRQSPKTDVLVLIPKIIVKFQCWDLKGGEFQNHVGWGKFASFFNRQLTIIGKNKRKDIVIASN